MEMRNADITVKAGEIFHYKLAADLKGKESALTSGYTHYDHDNGSYLPVFYTQLLCLCTPLFRQCSCMPLHHFLLVLCSSSPPIGCFNH